jgi:hypothetical protein
MAAPHVSFPDGSGGVKFPSVPTPPPGAKGCVIRHKSAGLIPISDEDGEPSKWDRADCAPGPQSVPPPKAAPDTGGLPAEWLGRAATKTVDHD